MANDENRGPQRDRTIGAGMNSPDSTQMPLRASTGEPNWDTQSNRDGGSRDGGSRDADDRGAGAESADAASPGPPRGARQNTGGDAGV